MSAFDGFPPQTLEFLDGLGRNNNKAWFDAHRTEYERYWLEVGCDFVVAAGEHLRTIRPDIVADPRINGSLFRINRDVRFSKDKTPYKDHLDIWFWEGKRKGAVSTFFFRLTASSSLVGVGSHQFDRDQLARFRQQVQNRVHGPELVRIANSLEYGLDGETLKRTPAVAAAVSDDQARLLRHTSASTMAQREAGPWVQTPEVLDWALGQWRQMAPLQAWLVDNVATG
ncbi:MAG: DUF2461 domain-containing protein [Actinomycetes bacterium]